MQIITTYLNLLEKKDNCQYIVIMISFGLLSSIVEAGQGIRNTRTVEGQIFQLNIYCQRYLCVKTTFHSYLKRIL